MTPERATEAPRGRTLFGHPRALSTLFLTELWERFSFYGMRALLVLYLAAPLDEGGLGLKAATAAGLYAVYNATVYLLALPGGWVADRLWGARRAVLVGGVIIALGHYTMAVPAGAATTYAGLVLIAVGTGLLKPNISTMVGNLYGEHDTRRDAGFSIFYMGINIGAFAAPLVTGYLGEEISWHAGFGAAGVGMTLGLIQYVLGARGLRGLGAPPERRATWAETAGPAFAKVAAVVGGTVLAVAVAVAVMGVSVQTFVGVFGVLAVLVPLAYFAVMLRTPGLTPLERGRVRAFGWIFLAATIFWVIYEQAGSLLNLFAEEKVTRDVLGFEFPASWFQSVNPLLIILLAPLFAWLWTSLGERQPATPVKFALGLVGVGLSFAVMALAAFDARGGDLVSPLWLVSVYLVQTVAELLLSPVGLSVSTKLAPERFLSQVMGLWFLAIATGNAINTQVVRLDGILPDAAYYGLLGGLAVLAGLAMLAYRRQIKALMAGVD
jgi:POT family proton-dependent oligopeptide transporter